MRFCLQSKGLALITLACCVLAGCGGLESFSPTARAGDTVALAAGWTQTFERTELTITITGSDGVPIVIPPNDPSVRAVINLYPDPLSYIVVGTRVGLGANNYRYGSTYGSVVNSGHTNYDPDWYETTVYIDLPTALPEGVAEIHLESSAGEVFGPPIKVTILPGVGAPTKFSAESNGPLSPVQIRSMERAPFTVVDFSGGSTLPSAIEILLTHAPDASAGGTGKPLVVNPRGEMKNLSWNSDGTNMKVLLYPSGKGTENDPSLASYGLKYFKFYVTGGITGVQVASVKAFDINGEAIPGVTATVN